MTLFRRCIMKLRLYLGFPRIPYNTEVFVTAQYWGAHMQPSRARLLRHIANSIQFEIKSKHNK